MFITGGGSGIGRATAVAFGAQGARVAVMGRTPSKLRETVELVEQAGGQGLALVGDVSNGDDIAKAVKEVVELGPLHFACLFAGIGEGAGTTISETSEESWDAHVDTALKGTFMCFKQLCAVMPEGGAVVTMSSMAAHAASVVPPVPYEVAKAGIEAFTRRACLEAAPGGVRVNCVAPGLIKTPLTAGLDPEVPPGSVIVNAVPLRRIGTAEEVAQVVLFLCSSQASYVNGTVVHIDGGVTAKLAIGL